MNKIKAIVFDWDGVIVDSMPIIAGGIQSVLASYGVRRTIEDILQNYFQPRQAYYASLGIVPEDIEELHNKHNKAVAEFVGVAPIFPDVLEALKTFKSRGYILAIATQNESRDAVQETIRVGVKDFFPENLIIGGRSTKADKLKHIISIINCSPGEVLYVGDLPTDIDAAHTAGVRSVGLARLKGQEVRLKARNPDFLCDSLGDLLKQLS